jgi:hypothetical protein
MRDLPRFPEFKRVGLEDKTAVEGFIERFPSEACELNFANIYTWRDYERTQLTTINGNLCLFCRPGLEPAFFLPPLGACRLTETIEACLSFYPRLACVPESYLPNCQGFHWEEDKSNFDYVYRSSDLIRLPGKKYDGKRNRIKKFETSCLARYFRLKPEHLGSCRSLYEDWYTAKVRQNGQMGQAQRVAVLETLAHFQELSLVGGAVEVDGRVEAFSIGGRLNDDTAVIHIEIANPAFEGLAQFINREFIKNEWASCRYINREQDMSMPGLRRAKMSYHPVRLIKKFVVRK